MLSLAFRALCEGGVFKDHVFLCTRGWSRCPLLFRELKPLNRFWYSNTPRKGGSLRTSLLKISDIEVHPFPGSGLSSTCFEDDAAFSERPWGGSGGFAHLGRDGPAAGVWDGSAAGVHGLRFSDRPPELGQEAAGPPLIARQERRAAGGGAGEPPPCRQPQSAGVWDEPASGGWGGPGTAADHHRSAAVLGEDTQCTPPSSVLGGLQRESHPPSALTLVGKHSD